MIMRRRPGQTKPNHVLAIVTDADNCYPMTEELLDTWWNALAPEAKAEIFEASLAEPEPAKLDIRITAGPVDFDAVAADTQRRLNEIANRAFLPHSTQH